MYQQHGHHLGTDENLRPYARPIESESTFEDPQAIHMRVKF